MFTEAEIEKSILGLLRARDEGKTICPSEAARSLWPDDWRDHMEDVRRVGRALEAEGRLKVFQRGKQVDPEIAVGPIRYGLPDG